MRNTLFKCPNQRSGITHHQRPRTPTPLAVKSECLAYIFVRNIANAFAVMTVRSRHKDLVCWLFPYRSSLILFTASRSLEFVQAGGAAPAGEKRNLFLNPVLRSGPGRRLLLERCAERACYGTPSFVSSALRTSSMRYPRLARTWTTGSCATASTSSRKWSFRNAT